MRVAQSCLTLCDPMDYTVHGMLQARMSHQIENTNLKKKKNYFKAKKQTKPTSGVEKYNSASELYFRPKKIGKKKKPSAMCQHNLAKNSDLTRDSQNNFMSKRIRD